MRLEGKLVLVTGAGSGIGRAFCRAAAERGARLVLVGRRPAALDETLAALPRPGEHRVAVADVTDAGDRRALAASLAEGRLDVLVNNAGVVAVGPLAQAEDAELRRVLETNVLAPMALTRELLPVLRSARQARVVNVGSVFGDIAYPLFAAYSASKFGLRGFSEALRRELHGSGIGVTYVAPRATRTPAAGAFAALVGPMGMTLDAPEAVAAGIVRAVERDARDAYPRGAERLFVLLQRLFPGVIDRAVGGQTRHPEIAAILQAPGAAE